MRRILVLILTTIYLGTTTGTSMHLHFCKGELADWSLWVKNEKKACGKCGMEKEEKPAGCCTDEHIWVKIQDDQKASVVLWEFSHFPPGESLRYFDVNDQIYFIESAILIPKNHAPPRRSDRAIYKRNCVFLI